MTDEDTTAKGIMLLDAKIGELVRKHLKEALEDPAFVSQVYPVQMANRLGPEVSVYLQNNSSFVTAIARGIGERLAKGYY